MDVAIWTGLIVVLLVSIVFMGPGLWSESLDYPVVNWVIRKLRRKPAPAADPAAPASGAPSTSGDGASPGAGADPAKQG